MAKDTTTGAHFEDVTSTIIERSCTLNNLTYKSQVNVGEKPGGGRHFVDYELTSILDSKVKGLISCKVQNTSGTTEEKVVYEVIKLAHVMRSKPEYKRAWIVLGGTGWSPKMKSFCLNDLIREWFPTLVGKIEVVSTDGLITNGVKL